MRNKQKNFVLGLGKSGRSACRYLHAQGAHVVAADAAIASLAENSEVQQLIKDGIICGSDQQTIDFSAFTLFVLSPGISRKHPLVQQARAAGVEVIGEIELAARDIKQPAIGITGTNGKTTVTLLVAHILNACGIPARAVGNVGTPLTEELLHTDEKTVLVIELSSYQLETLASKIFDVAALLNITPDHLDRYDSMHAYAAAKAGLQGSLKEGSQLYVEQSAYEGFSSLFKKNNCLFYGYHSSCALWTDGTSVFYEKNKSFLLPLQYRGKISHEIENLMAAFALCHHYGIDATSFLQAFDTFSKPPHRIEFVRRVNGVDFINDSKGTNIDAVIRAVQTIEGTLVLIAGGIDKGTPFTPWIKNFTGKVKGICAIGEAAKKIESELSHAFPVARFDTLDEAVHAAAQMSCEGDTVLLSPGCSSFDMFKDYVHRGEAFKQSVADL